MILRLFPACALVPAILLAGGVAAAQAQTPPAFSPASADQNGSTKPIARSARPNVRRLASSGHQLTPSAAPLDVTGTWTDTYSYQWTLIQDQSGNVTGTVNVNACTNPIWSVDGSAVGDQMILITTNPAGGDEVCDSGFEYDLTLSSDGSTASGPWASDYNTGSVTMSRVCLSGDAQAARAEAQAGSCTPSIQITLVNQPANNQYLITADPSMPPTMPVIQATAAVMNVTPDPTPTRIFTWTADLAITKGDGTTPVDYADRIRQPPQGPPVTTTGSDAFTLTFADPKAFYGGTLTLTVTATLPNGQTVTGTTPANLASQNTTNITIYGTNPQRSDVQNYIATKAGSLKYGALQPQNVVDTLDRVACEESGPAPKGQTQFAAVPGSSGPPIVAGDNGIGMMQITVTKFTPDYFFTNPGILFNWQTNVATGVTTYRSKVKTSGGYPAQLQADDDATDPDSYQYYINHTINTARTAQGLMPITFLPAPLFSNLGNIGSNPPDQLLEDGVRGYNGFAGSAPFNIPALHEFVPNATLLMTASNAQLTTLSTNPSVWMRVCSNPGNGTLYGPVGSSSCATARGTSGDPLYVNNIAANIAQCPAGAQRN